jgi:hypothetical protein
LLVEPSADFGLVRSKRFEPILILRRSVTPDRNKDATARAGSGLPPGPVVHRRRLRCWFPFILTNRILPAIDYRLISLAMYSQNRFRRSAISLNSSVER